MGARLTPGDVERAHAVLAAHRLETPLRESLAVPGADVRIKLECWQPTGSFKVRGATHFLSILGGEERRRGVVAASAGNHALGVAFAASRLRGALSVTLFVPRTAPRSKVEKLRRFPVEVRETGDTYDDAAEAATAFQQETGATFLHAFEDVRTAAGQGTVGLEILDACPEVGTILVPVGGGGLIAGIATVVKARSPHVRIVGVQAAASPSLAESLRLGRPLLTYPAKPTLADGIAGGIGEIAFDHRDLVDEVVNVEEEEIGDAMVALLAADQVVSEAAGAVGIAALRRGRVAGGAGPAVAVITGGNVDAGVLARLLAERYPGGGPAR